MDLDPNINALYKWVFKKSSLGSKETSKFNGLISREQNFGLKKFTLGFESKVIDMVLM